jgi:hypothetical protein
MKTKISIMSIVVVLVFVASTIAQESGAAGFVITLKNGSTMRGRTLARDEASGKLRLTMTESSGGSPKSFAIVSMDDAEAIRASTTESDSIRIKLVGGSELRCKEFGLNGDNLIIKLGTASRIEVRWDQIESISFAQ